MSERLLCRSVINNECPVVILRKCDRRVRESVDQLRNIVRVNDWAEAWLDDELRVHDGRLVVAQGVLLVGQSHRTQTNWLVTRVDKLEDEACGSGCRVDESSETRDCDSVLARRVPQIKVIIDFSHKAECSIKDVTIEAAIDFEILAINVRWLAIDSSHIGAFVPDLASRRRDIELINLKDNLLARVSIGRRIDLRPREELDEVSIVAREDEVQRELALHLSRLFLGLVDGDCLGTDSHSLSLSQRSSVCQVPEDESSAEALDRSVWVCVHELRDAVRIGHLADAGLDDEHGMRVRIRVLVAKHVNLVLKGWHVDSRRWVARVNELEGKLGRCLNLIHLTRRASYGNFILAWLVILQQVVVLVRGERNDAIVSNAIKHAIEVQVRAPDLRCDVQIDTAHIGAGVYDAALGRADRERLDRERHHSASIAILVGGSLGTCLDLNLLAIDAVEDEVEDEGGDSLLGSGHLVVEERASCGSDRDCLLLAERFNAVQVLEEEALVDSGDGRVGDRVRE